MTQDNCVFCDKNVIREGLLGETENFYVRANAIGTMAPGHLMVISKKHYSCFGALPKDLDEEYTALIKKVKEKVENKFSTPILTEQGVHKQSIKHAHIHFLPSVSERYSFSDKKFIDLIPQEIKIEFGKGILGIRKVVEEDGEYVSIQEDGKLYICRTKGYNGKFGPIRQFVPELIGLTKLLDWQKMSAEELERDKKWVKKTIDSLEGRVC